MKSQIVGAITELGRILMSKSSLTARLRTSMSQAAYRVGCSQEVATISRSSWASAVALTNLACVSARRRGRGVGCDGSVIVVLCEPEAADPSTVRPDVETLSAPNTLTASGNGEILEGIQALHLDCSTMRSCLARVQTQIGQMVVKAAGSMIRTTSST